MSIHNKGALIQMARKKANLTQEQLASGICSTNTLSLIENGTLTISSSYFEALLSRTGASYSAYPHYHSRCDFDCFYTLKRASFFMNSWQLEKAYDELDFVEKQNWANNIFHYSEWIMLHGKLQLLSGCCKHQENYDFLLYGLQLTHPTLDLTDFKNHLFSITELEYLLLLAEEKLYLTDSEGCVAICTQIEHYLSQSHITYLDKERLQAHVAIIMGKYYYSKNECDIALSLVEPHRHTMAINSDDLPLFRLTFLKGLCLYQQGEKADALKTIKTVLYSAHAIDSCYATICYNYLHEHMDIDVDTLFPLSKLELKNYSDKYFILEVPTNFNNLPTANYLDYLSLGEIIKQIREEKNLSQEIICQGLCTKSTLSKIEHNHMQPDIFLLEALLQRLGLSERPFLFYGNKKEHEFYTYKFKSMRTQLLGTDVLKDYIREFEKSVSPKNNLQQQELLMAKIPLCKTPEEELSMYFEALHYTLPNFDIARIHEFRLSWAELTILNNIARLYIKSDTPTKSIYYYNQLESYYYATKPDAIFQKNVYVPMLEMYCHCLYIPKHYIDIKHFFTTTHRTLFRSSTNRFSFFLFFFCQAYGELKAYEEAYLFGNYSCALSTLNELHINSSYLQKYLIEDFEIKLVEF